MPTPFGPSLPSDDMSCVHLDDPFDFNFLLSTSLGRCAKEGVLFHGIFLPFLLVAGHPSGLQFLLWQDRFVHRISLIFFVEVTGLGSGLRYNTYLVFQGSR